MNTLLMLKSILVVNNSSVVGHVLPDVSEEQAADDADTSKCKRDVVHPRIAFCVRELAGENKHIVLGVGVHSRNGPDLWEQTSGGQPNDTRDGFRVGDVHLVRSATDQLDCIAHELLAENIVVYTISNSTTEDTDGEGEGSDGSDKLIRTDDGTDDTCGNDDAADAETGDDEEDIAEPEIVAVEGCECSATSCHEDTRDKHQLPNATSGVTKENKNDAGTSQDGETEAKVALANLPGIMTVHVVRLRWPEEQDREEVGSGDEGDDKGERKDPWFVRNCSRKHGIFREFELVEDERDEHDRADDERRQHMSRCPLVLVATPLDSAHEEQETSNGEETTNKVDALEDLATGQA